ncbi:MAG: caspase family protein [Pseudomonadota bacterium]
MRFIATCIVALTYLMGISSEDAFANNRLKRIIGSGVGLGIGAAIVNEFNKQNRRSNDARAASRVDPRQKWQDLAPVNGRGTTVCHTDQANYYCLALRCGQGRGLEFAWIFSGGSIESGRQVPVHVDDELVDTLTVNALDPSSELVFAYESGRHEYLMDRLKAGRTVSLTFDSKLTLSLRGSSKALNKTLKMCANEIGTGALVANSGNSSPKPTGGPDLSWRKDDTEELYIARIRDSAVEHGGPCDVERAIFEQLQRDIKVEVDQQEIKAGEFVSVEWRGNSLDQLIPAYLIVATDAAVRFRGDGFYTLMPNAIGPFGIESLRDKTRAIVALYGKGAQKAGKIEIEGLLAGEMPLEMAVVGWQRKCKSEIAEVRSLGSVEIKPAATPVISIVNPLAETTSNSYFVSQNNSRMLEVGNSGFRILTPDLADVILNIDGKNAKFSSTGRFVAVQRNSGIEIYDAVDGKMLISDVDEGGHSTDADVAWINSDSFVLIGRNRYGIANLRNSVLPLRSDLQGAYGIRIERGYLAANLSIDLQNDMLISSAESNSESLYTRFLSSIPYKFVEGLNSPIGNEIDPNHLVSPATVLNSWEGLSDIWFSHLVASYSTWGEESISINEAPKKRLISSKLVQMGSGQTNSEQDLLQVDLARRSLSAISNEEGKRPRLSSTIQSFKGLEHGAISEPVETANAHIDWNDPNADYDAPEKLGEKTAQRIGLAIPGADQIFVGKENGYPGQCQPDEIGDLGQSTMFKKVSNVTRYLLGEREVWILHNSCVEGSGAFDYSTLAVFDSEDEQFARFPELALPDNTIGTGCESIKFCDFQTRIFNSNKLVFYSSQSSAVAVFDLDTHEVVFKKYNLPRGNALSDVKMTDDSNHLIQLNSDGSFFVHRIYDGETVLEGRTVDDEVVVWTPDMRFDSTAEGAHFVNLRFPGQIGQYTFQQFDSRLRVAGLVKRVLSGDYELQAVDVGVPPRLSGSLDAVEGRILGEVIPQSLGDLRGIRVYQDGVLTNEVLALESGIPVEIDVKRLDGARWVSLVAVDEDGLVSLPVGRDLGSDSELAKVRLLAIGVDQYDDERIQDLGLAKADAFTLSGSLESANGKTIDLVQTDVLSDSEATPDAVLAAAKRLVAEAKPGEQAVFFFAGHGVKGEDGRFYMATSATDPENISGTALSWDRLSTVLAKSRARMTVFLDACHSGAAGTDFFATNDDAASGILKNIPSGLTVFSASKGRELSEENTALGGGQFTKAAASVIATDRLLYDLNQNGVIEVSELYLGVKRQVVKRTEGRQTPWLARNQMVGDFALF